MTSKAESSKQTKSINRNEEYKSMSNRKASPNFMKFGRGSEKKTPQVQIQMNKGSFKGKSN